MVEKNFSFIVTQYFLISIAACRYDKGTWSECDKSGDMTRTDKLKASSDGSCQQTRTINKKCNKSKQDKKERKEKKQKGKKSDFV